MRKLAYAAIAALALFSGGPVVAQGTLPIALQQSVDGNGKPLRGALLYIYVGGTTNVQQTAFSDVGLTQALPWPVPADANGRLPMFYLPSGSVGVRLTDAAGGQQFYYPSMLVVGPSGGGGGGGSTTPTSAIFTTGDVKFRMTAETLVGWVKLNGQTIGSASSGSSGRANADTQALFVYLWTNCPQSRCAVIGGRGATGLADFQANRQITLPDMRDRLPLGRDCMENTCQNLLLSGNIASGGGDTVDTGGAFGGAVNPTIALVNLPTTHLAAAGSISVPNISFSGGADGTISARGTAGGTINFASGGNVGHNFSSSDWTMSWPAGYLNGLFVQMNTGSQSAFPVINPFVLGSWYMSL